MKKALLIALLVGFFTKILVSTTPENSLLSVLKNDVGLASSLFSSLTCSMVTCIYPSDLPYTITSPGSYYLADDIPSNASIIVQSNNVSLNLNGRTLNADAMNSAIIAQNCCNIRIYNGAIQVTSPTTSTNGISLNSCSNVSIKDIVISNCYTGIVIQDSSHTTVKNCLAQNGWMGISLTASATANSNHTIVESAFVNNSVAGIQVFSPSLAVSSVRISDCHLSTSSINTSIMNPTFGIYANQTMALAVDRCVITNATYGIAVMNSYGISVRDSKIFSSGIHGIQCSISSNENALQTLRNLTFENVIIDGAQTNSLYCSQCSHIKVKECTFTNSQSSAVYLSQCSNAVVEKSIFSNVVGATLPIVSIGDSAGMVNAIKITECNLANYAPGTGLNALSCTNIANAILEKCYLSVNSESSGLNGCGIFATGNVSNLLIDACTVTNNPATGICLANTTSSSNNVLINRCHILGAATNGILLTNTQNCVVRENTILNAPNGISLVQVTGATIVNNILSFSMATGVSLDANTNNCGVYDNILSNISNPFSLNAVGVTNGNSQNSIYHNLVYSSNNPYENVNLVVNPQTGIGAYENIQSQNISE